MATTLEDVTKPDNRTGKPDEWSRVHAIYVTAEGRDYCREDGPARITTHADAAKWAIEHFAIFADSFARRAVSGFRIEFW